MSLASNIARSLYEDLRHAALTPYRGAKEVRYTIKGLQEGTIPPKNVAWTIVSTGAALLVTALLMFPIYWITTIALNPSGGVYTTSGVRLIPETVSFQEFAWVIGPITTPKAISIGLPFIGDLVSIPVPEVIANKYIFNPTAYGVENTFTAGQLISYGRNSAYIAFFTVVIGMPVILSGAYGMSRRDFLGRKRLLYIYVLLTQVAGSLGVALLIALYALFNLLGWMDPGANTRFWLAVYYAGGAVPFNTWLLKTYMDGIPISYEEAAIVDGASSLRVVYEIIIPLAKAGLATVFVFVFLAGWTEYIVAQNILSSGQYTLPVGVYALSPASSGFQVAWSKFAAFSLTFAMPLMLVYFFMQRYIQQGLSFGGMEG